YLMPDTYRFFWQTEEREIIERMVNEFKSFFVDSLKSRQKGMNMSLNQVLTLASIVEGETSLDRERTTVAGVYHNRLKRRMRLEADPTIQYIVPDGPRRLLYSDLKIDSPFNTYRNYGLPPAPIGSPGRLSILATLYPEQHAYLFFVADGTGGHKFSRNYAEHQRAVREWRRARRELQQQAARNSDPTDG
ncbi:MAG: endolytic transglycosylase MltG, partial [Bacteroidota bacterium]